MLRALERLLTSGRTAITLIVVLLTLTSLGYILPQRTASGALSSRFDLPSPLLTASQWLGFDRMFSSPVYLGMLVVCLIALLAALRCSARSAWQRTVHPVVGAGSLGVLHTAVAAADAAAILRRAGYHRWTPVGSSERYVRDPWGLWGGFVLHLGLVVTVAMAIVVLSTESWAIIGLAEGEVLEPGEPWSNSEPGPLASDIVLRETLRLDRVTPEFWDTGAVRQISSDLTFLNPDGGEAHFTIAVNGSRVRHGVRFYQEQVVGHAFLLEIDEGGGGAPRRERVDMVWPVATDEPAYHDLDLGGGDRLQLKYYTDSARASMTGRPQLWGRYARGEVRGESVILPVDAPVEVGPLTVELKMVLAWTNIIAVRDHGVPLLFAGFFLIFVGSTLIYLTVPREVFVTSDADGCTIQMRALRFPRMCSEEFGRIADSLGARRGGRSD
jgi:hypothetical protein